MQQQQEQQQQQQMMMMEGPQHPKKMRQDLEGELCKLGDPTIRTSLRNTMFTAVQGGARQKCVLVGCDGPVDDNNPCRALVGLKEPGVVVVRFEDRGKQYGFEQITNSVQEQLRKTGWTLMWLHQPEFKGGIQLTSWVQSPLIGFQDRFMFKVDDYRDNKSHAIKFDLRSWRMRFMVSFVRRTQTCYDPKNCDDWRDDQDFCDQAMLDSEVVGLFVSHATSDNVTCRRATVGDLCDGDGKLTDLAWGFLQDVVFASSDPANPDAWREKLLCGQLKAALAAAEAAAAAEAEAANAEVATQVGTADGANGPSLNRSATGTVPPLTPGGAFSMPAGRAAAGSSADQVQVQRKTLTVADMKRRYPGLGEPVVPRSKK